MTAMPEPIVVQIERLAPGAPYVVRTGSPPAVLVASSTQPLIDAANALLGQGQAASTYIVMRRTGPITNQLAYPLGEAAQLVLNPVNPPPETT